MRIKSLSAAVAALACFAGSASATTIANGSFEAQNIVTGGFVDTFSAGFNPTGLNGWTVGSGSVDLVSSGLWDPADGNFSVDMNGNQPGAIYQDLTGLVTGQVYDITFALAGNPYAQEIHTLGVQVGMTAPVLHQFDTSGLSNRNMGWVDQTYSFTATQDTMRLTFYSDSVGTERRAGPALDNIRIATAAVPLPATGLLLIGALGALGFSRRRRS